MGETHLDTDVEFAVNPEPRCPCLLLLDTSSSMEGERIEALTAGLRTFRTELRRDRLAAKRLEIAVVSFNSKVTVEHDFTTIDAFDPPRLTASGETHMAEAIDRALDLTEARKKRYRRNGIVYYRPWIFMITDGKPEGESESDVERVVGRLRRYEAEKRVAFFAVAVEGADVQRLGEISVRKPAELEGLDFGQMFVWLSASMQSVSKSRPGEAVALPEVGWLKRIAVFVKENEEDIKAVARTIGTVVKVGIGF